MILNVEMKLNSSILYDSLSERETRDGLFRNIKFGCIVIDN